jgi:hypothetical protein
MWGLWRTKLHWGRFSPSTSVSPANSHSTDCFTRIIVYRPGGLRIKWIQSRVTPKELPLCFEGLILCRKMITVYSENNAKHTNTPRGQEAESVNVKQVVHSKQYPLKGESAQPPWSVINTAVTSTDQAVKRRTRN